MNTAEVVPQVEKLIRQIGRFVTPSEENMLDSTSTIISVIFGYKLIELAIVSLGVTVKSKGLLPLENLCDGNGDILHCSEQLYQFGVIDYELYEKLLRIFELKPLVHNELQAFSSSLLIYDGILEDIQQILKGTESLVAEMCEETASVS